ncbi:MAG: glycosyltransferase [Anaerolineae bacterium]
MRVLLLTSQLPYPPQSGGALRVYGLIDSLHQAGHQVDLLSFGVGAVPSPLAERCGQVVLVPPPHRSKLARLRDLALSSQPDIARRFWSDAYREALIHQLANDYAVVQMESIEMTAYLGVIRQHSGNAVRIYDSFNAEYELQRTMAQIDLKRPQRWIKGIYSLIQYRRLMRFEREVCDNVEAVIAVSQPDEEAFRQLAPAAKIFVVPNGIHVDRYAEPAAEQIDLGEAAILFTGSLDYRPNVDAVIWFAESVLPLIRAQVPSARFLIVGRKPSAQVQALADQHNGISVIADVPAMQPYYAAAAVYVAPLRMGSGTRLKLLEAMASQRAIVATTMGAAGLGVTSGRELIIADEAAAFAQAVITLLRDADQRREMGAAGRTFVCQHYDWSALSPRLLQVYTELQGNLKLNRE